MTFRCFLKRFLVFAAALTFASQSATSATMLFPGTPSRQLSACSFIVSFDFNDAKMDDLASQTMTSAVSAASSYGEHLLTVTTYSARGEHPTIRTLRADTIESWFHEQGVPDTLSIRSAPERSDIGYQAEPFAFVWVCGSGDARKTTSAADAGDKLIDFKFGNSPVSIPARVLGGRFVWDPPFEPIRIDTFYSLLFLWPGLTPWTGDRECGVPVDSPCRKSEIQVRLSSAEGNASQGPSIMMPSGDDVVSLPSAKLAVRDSPAQARVDFYTLPAGPGSIVGWCWWRLEKGSSSAEVELDLLQQARDCWVERVQLDGGMQMRLQFTSDHLLDIEVLLNSTKSLMNSFIRRQ